MTESVAAVTRPDEDPGSAGSGGLSTGRVVVGVDGSRTSVAALRWAVHAAADHGWAVDVVTAWPDPDEVFVHEVPGHFCAPRGRAVAEQRTTIAAADARESGVTELRTFIDNAHPADALVARSADASVIVVGASGHTRQHVDRLPIGDSCALLAHCPVVVVDDTSSQGDDGS